MMGGETPETCWAVNKRQDNKLENCCIWLVIYLNCTMMHGRTNLKFVNSKQAGEIYSYTNIKRKLHKTIAAIWFNNKTQHDCHHDTKVKPEAATAVTELLMMGGETPETCWTVNKRQDNKLENCCIWLVIYLNWKGVPPYRNNLLSSSSQYIHLKSRKITYSMSHHTTDTLEFSGVASRISTVTVWRLPNVVVQMAAFVARTSRLWHSVTVAFRCVITHQPTAWIMFAMDATHILQKWVKLLPIVRKVRVQNSVNNCQHTLCNNSKERWPYLHRDGS